LLAALFVTVVVAIGLNLGSGWVPWWQRADPPAQTVLFVVVDTLRADRTSLCGYERPTTPTLEQLRASGAAVACQAIAPGSWTVPSHASYFTGLPVTEHGAHFTAEGEVIRALSFRPLAARFPTLAEEMVERGYQTAGVSGNPVLAPATGLTRGFGDWRVAPSFGPWYGEALVAELRDVLRSLDPGRPLFLFVNVADAHDPFGAIPEGVDWLPETHPGLLYFEHRDGGIDPEGVWQRYVRGEMEMDEAEALRKRVGDLYDFAVHRADGTLGSVLEEVKAFGWAKRGLRLVVVSDHGELLGEHGLLRHGRVLYEGNNRVPLLVLDSEATPALPERLSALDVTTLVRDGRLPEPAHRREAVAFPDALWASQSGGRVGRASSAALWVGDEKLVWQDGELRRFDLEADPEEARPLSVEASGERASLVELGEEVTRSRASASPALDPALVERLRAAGYVE
jgi:hypothetical protein